MDKNWTPEPWRIKVESGLMSDTTTVRGDNDIIVMDDDIYYTHTVAIPDMIRAVECVNAMRDIPDPAAYVEAFEAMRRALMVARDWPRSVNLETHVREALAMADKAKGTPANAETKA